MNEGALAFIFIFINGIITLIDLSRVRRVTVYGDRIEVRFPFHKAWNYCVMIRDIDCYCMGGSANDDEDEDSSSDTIFLLSGKKLWVYADKKSCDNFEQMQVVLEDFFGIAPREGFICLSNYEKEKVLYGESLSLDDISTEELRALRDNQIRPRATQTQTSFEEPSPSKKNKNVNMGPNHLDDSDNRVCVFIGTAILHVTEPYGNNNCNRPQHCAAEKRVFLCRCHCGRFHWVRL